MAAKVRTTRCAYLIFTETRCLKAAIAHRTAASRASELPKKIPNAISADEISSHCSMSRYSSRLIRRATPATRLGRQRRTVTVKLSMPLAYIGNRLFSALATNSRSGIGTLSVAPERPCLKVGNFAVTCSTPEAKCSGSLGHTTGAGDLVGKRDGRDFSRKGSTTLERTAQQKGCPVCGKRPVLVQLYQHICTRARIHHRETTN